MMIKLADLSFSVRRITRSWAVRPMLLSPEESMEAQVAVVSKETPKT